MEQKANDIQHLEKQRYHTASTHGPKLCFHQDYTFTKKNGSTSTK